MKVIAWARQGQAAVVCANSGGIYLTSMRPITDKHIEDINTALQEAGLEASEPCLSPLPDYGDLIPVDEWLSTVKTGGFIDYDGHGYWATKEGMWCGLMQEFMIKPSDITNHPHTVPAWATHVMWFNR